MKNVLQASSIPNKNIEKKLEMLISNTLEQFPAKMVNLNWEMKQTTFSCHMKLEISIIILRNPLKTYCYVPFLQIRIIRTE